MDTLSFHDGNITDLINSRTLHPCHEINFSMQMHSSLIKRLSLERELEGHLGCVNAMAWNSSGSLLLSGSDDTQIKIWGYTSRQLLHSIETGHSGNIFCTKFVPETSDELVVSGAADAEVRVFCLSRLREGGFEENSVSSSALYQCHTRRVKKLAVEVGNPNVVWSASEDGTLRQHDLREGTSCPPAGSSHQECRNVLLDLRCGAKKSLSDPPKQCLRLKSCDISSTRPHLLLVGGSDVFARLYDRRMLPPLSSFRKKLSPPHCVNYFCPMHLSEQWRSSLHLTHVTFSPNGEEVLLNYSGEHTYLMDVNPARESTMRYTSGDMSRLINVSRVLNGVELQPSSVSYNSPIINPVPTKLDKCRKLIQIAEKFLEEAKYYHGIEVSNEVVDVHGLDIGPTLMHECLCIRASLLLKRKWKNDAYMVLRDCHRALKIDSSSVRAMLLMSEALSQLGKHKEALDYAVATQFMAPSNSVAAERVETIKRHIDAEAERSIKTTEEAPKSGPQAGRMLSLSDILYLSDANSDASQDGPRSEREDSDYDEEAQMTLETSTSGDEGHDSESNILHGGLNVRVDRRVDSFLDYALNSYSSRSRATSLQDERAAYKPEIVIDMKQRYVGHCNVGTDIKQASFLGERGEFVASGSDDGRWFIWEKKTGRLIKMLKGDETVVNCIQCHPFDCVMATSGIDNTIKIWTPTACVPSMVTGGAAGPEMADVLNAMESNQQRLCHNREAILPFEILERFPMHECTQS